MLPSVLLAAILVVPGIVALARARDMAVPDFVFNAGRNGLPQTLASVVCGNIGIGTFVAIFLFTRASPVIGIAIAVAYTAGLVLCALLAGRIHAASARIGAFGLVDLVVATHRVRRPLLIWLPVAAVFILRIMVQLGALALILAEAFGLPGGWALALATLISGLYVAIGGYRAATETDLFHATIILLLMALVAAALPAALAAAFAATSTGELATTKDLLDLGPYRPVLLVGIFLFLPFTPVLGIDNWQRIATARSAGVAARAYLFGAVACGLCYATIVAAALLPGPEAADVLAGFRALMPGGAPWLADILFASAIISTIDTFVVPLVATFARSGVTLGRLRALVVALFAAVALLTALLGDLLAGVVAAFNSLAVFLPAICGALLLRAPRPEAAIVSLPVGVAASLALTAIDLNSAGPIGFAASAASYLIAQRVFAGRPL